MKHILTSAILLAFAFTAWAGPVQKVSLNSDSNIVHWKLCPDDAVSADAATANVCPAGEWIDAVVPGATFTSYVEAGIEPDPNFGDNAYKVDKSKYAKNYWYRTEVATADIPQGEHQWLCFEGINRKGEVFFNGVRLGLLDGFMDRGKFDVAGLVRKDGGANVIAVHVFIPTKPIANLASPTYISSDGWDWMPSVPGLLGGIVDDVYFTTSGPVRLEDVWVRTTVPSQDEGRISISADLKIDNPSDGEHKIVIKGDITPGNIHFERDLSAMTSNPRYRRMFNQGTLSFTPEEFKQLIVHNPALWWPNGYGEQNLYTCRLSCEVDGTVSDENVVKFGIREYSYAYDKKGVFQISCNGEKIFCKGGNWGMSEYMLRCRGEEYDLKIRLHKEMNYNMIRNWIGSTTDEEFYEACDKYGVMVFDDFWLNSHPNLPTDVFAFNRNAVEKIKRLRNHPCIAVWCGDNEGVPRPPLNEWLREDVKVYDGGDRWYQPISREFGLSGSGPWTNAHPIWYFTQYPSGFGENKLDGWGFRSEIGTAVFVNYESLKKFFPDADKWPLDSVMLERHFFGRSSFNSRPDRYFSSVEYNYGKAEGTEDFCIKAQLLNFEANKAMYEGWQHHMWNDAAGILTWMSQSAYPSLVWQTYDYYYDLNGAYWGVKKACEPVHIQWSYADNSVKAVNAGTKSYGNVNVEAHVYNLDGTEVKQFAKAATGSCPADRATYIMSLDLPEDSNLARGKKAYASSTGVTDYHAPEAVTDGNTGSAWSAQRGKDPWVYVDLEKEETFSSITISWESAVCEDYSILVSDDAKEWKEIYRNGKPATPIDRIDFEPVTARYVKLAGVPFRNRNMALHEIEIYRNAEENAGILTPVHFIRLKMTDAAGKLLSDNFYWRSNKLGDYTALNTLAPAKLAVKTTVEDKGDKQIMHATITNKGKGVAFGIRVMPSFASTGEQLTPAIMDANYFTLFAGESQKVDIEYDKALLGNDSCKLVVRAYNE